MEYVKAVCERIDYLNSILNKVTESLKTAPAGKLRIKRKNGFVRYYVRENEHDTNGKYLPKTETALIKQLAQKEYCEKLLRSVERELSALESLVDSLSAKVTGFDKVYESVSAKAREQLPPIMLPDRYFAECWQLQQYEPSHYYEEEKKYDTDRGEKVRSKSEALIANLLYSEGVPYKYECPLILGGHRIYPDFTLLDIRRNRELYWEHFGMIDDPVYAANAVRRISAYNVANGMPEGGGLIVTSESADTPLSIENLRKMVRGMGLSAA